MTLISGKTVFSAGGNMERVIGILKVLISLGAILVGVFVALDGVIALDYDTTSAIILFAITIVLVVASIMQIKYRKMSSVNIFVPAVLYALCAIVSLATLGNIADRNIIAIICGILFVVSAVLSIPAMLKK